MSEFIQDRYYVPAFNQPLYYDLKRGHFVLENYSTDTIQVMFFPIIEYYDILVVFSDKYLPYAPFLPISIYDVYYEFVNTLELNWRTDNFTHYLRSMIPSSICSDEFPIVRVTSNLLRSLFHRLKHVLGLFQEQNSEIYDHRLHKVFNKFSPKVFNRFNSKFLYKAGCTFLRDFIAYRNDRPIYCYCLVYKVIPNFRRRTYSIDELVTLSLEYMPSLFHMTKMSEIHQLYINNYLPVGDPWYSFYISYHCAQMIDVFPFLYTDGKIFCGA